ncbi:alpha/beta fold hydrolase [Kytococcus sedentarius]|uniref:alpha/beta fold hydrolase n=1 Tax=Kytococcus sedentarius TaxID=1276 RepID=UPI0035BBA710
MPEITRESTEAQPGLSVRTVRMEVPVDHGLATPPAAPSEALAGVDLPADTLELFARIVTGEGGQEKPYLVYLQGGPGGESPRPSLTVSTPSWLGRALQDFQVVLLDQRGTGLSTPVGSTVGPRGTAPGLTGVLAGTTSQQQAAYLQHFRADSIVADCELLRRALGIEQWTLLGQSFGGFTSLHYLARHPESLAGALITGGLPPVDHSIEEVYSATWELMVDKSRDFHRRFPADRERLAELTQHAAAGEIVLPNGDVVSPERFRTTGHGLGMSWGAERLHHLLERDHHSSAFSADLAGMLPFGGRNPLYSVLHESSMADGVATRWAADRTLPDEVAADPTLLGGEHLHRSLFTEDSLLAPFTEAADLLAQVQWAELYPVEALRRADVPVAAAVYSNDAYVPRDFSLETAGLLPDAQVYETSAHEHNGLSAGSDVLDHLIGLLQGTRWR